MLSYAACAMMGSMVSIVIGCSMVTSSDETPFIPIDIADGHTVRDSTNTLIGTVSYFRYGEKYLSLHPDEHECPALRDAAAIGGKALTDALTECEAMPNEIRRCLNRKGYIRIAQAGYPNDLFATMDKVSHVLFNTVYLNVGKEDLLAF